MEQNPGPINYGVNLYPQPDTYHMDKCQAAFLMYCFIKKHNYEDNEPVFMFDWNDDDGYDWRRLHMSHLVRVIVANSTATIADILTHPFFWSIQKLVIFEDRMRSYSSRHRPMDPWLEIGRHYVFAEQTWTENLPIEVVRAVRNVNNATVLGLWRGRRDRRHHRDEDAAIAQAMMGRLHGANFEFWQGYFPAFFMHLYKRLISYERFQGMKLHQTPEFINSEFFPSSAAFFAMMEAIDVYESII